MSQFEYLRYGLGIVLTFVGGKMLAADYYHVSTIASLVVIFTALASSIGASLVFARR